MSRSGQSHPELPGMPPNRRRRQTPLQRTAAQDRIRLARDAGVLERVPPTVIRGLLNTAEDYDSAVADPDASVFVRSNAIRAHGEWDDRFTRALGELGDDSLEAEQLRALRAANVDPPAA